MARVGGFSGPSAPYGIEPSSIHPRDNDITPDPAKAEADRLKSMQDEIYVKLQNEQREQNRKSTK